MGIVSCIVPEALVSTLTVLVGVLNIAGGLVNVTKIILPFVKRPAQDSDHRPPIIIKVSMTHFAMNIVTVLFGVTVLVRNLNPGLVLGVVLAANGCILTHMFYLLVVIDNPRTKEVGDVQVQ